MPPYNDNDDYSSDEDGSNYSDWTPTGDYIAVPDGPCTNPHDLADFYTSRVGGPVTPLASVPLPVYPECAACHRALFLLAQVHAPVADMDDRVMYVFGCNRRVCMTKPGSFVVVRGVSLVGPSPSARGAGDGDEEEVEIDEQEQASRDVVFGMVEGEADAFSGFGSSAGGESGDHFSSFGAAGNGDAAFAFGAGSSDTLQFILTPSASSSTKAASSTLKAEKTQQPPAPSSKKPPTKSLEEAMDALTLSTTTNGGSPPAFPAFYLSIDEEYVQSKHAKAAAYSHYRPGDGSLGEEDAAGDVDDGKKGRKASAAPAANANGSSGWDVSAEGYESTNIKGFTRHLERFLDRVEDNPSQVIRYNHGGSPLMYSDHHVLHLPADEAESEAEAKVSAGKGKAGAGAGRVAQARHRLPACPRCGGPRVYECQLMPTILSVLPVEKHAPEPTPAELEAMGNNPAMWVRGMEFGTVLVFTCGQNCIAKASEEEQAAGVMYVPEVCLVQLEQE